MIRVMGLILVTSRDYECPVLAVLDPERESGFMVENYLLRLVLSRSGRLIHLDYLRLAAECVGRRMIEHGLLGTVGTRR